MTSRPRLQTLIFEVTQRCNHSCLHCYNVWIEPPGVAQEEPYPRGELDTTQTLALLNKALDETQCSHVALTGGEPLLRPDLPQILDLLHERDTLSTVISNGRLLSKPVVADLLERRVGLFELPLLSHRREVHDYLSGSPGAFDAVLEAMAHIRSLAGQFVVVFVGTRFNLDDFYEVIKLAFAFGARGLMFNRFNPGGRGRAHLTELLPTAVQVRQALAVANVASERFNFPISYSIPIQPCLVDVRDFPHLSGGYCAAGSERAYYTLDPLGNLRPCNHTPMILGNLQTEAFGNIISPERLSAFVEAIPGMCGDCQHRLVCQGGCKAAAQVCYGSLTEEEPFLKRNLPKDDLCSYLPEN